MQGVLFDGCLERFAWFGPKSEGCLEQNAFRKSLFSQKRGMSLAKSLFYKPILTLNGKRGKNKKKMRHCDRLECYLYFMHQMRNVFAAVCGCLQLSVAVCSCLWLSVAVCGCLSLSVAICGCLWLSVAVCSCLWLSVAVCG